MGTNRLEEAHIRVRGEDDVQVIKVDSVVAELGFVGNLGPLANWVSFPAIRPQPLLISRFE